MKSKKHPLLLLFVLALLPCSVMAESTPQAVVDEFYKFHFAHDMGFTPATVQERKAWLSPELLKACESYFAIPQNPEEPPYINGDPFTNSQEYPESFKVGESKISENKSTVEITFLWKEAEPRKGIVVLEKAKDKWLIDDLQFAEESMRKLLEGPPSE